MTPLALIAIAGCLAVDPGSDQIRLRDMEGAFGDVSAAGPDTPVALAPAPGVQRVFGLPELRRIAARLGLPTQPSRELCFQRRVSVLDAERLLDAMNRRLPGATLRLLDYSRQPVPEGELDFPLSGLHRTPHGGYWNGFVRYAGNRRFLIWAKIEASGSSTRLVASVDLKAGQTLAAEFVRIETADAWPSPQPAPASVAEAAGKRLRRSVKAGSFILSAWLETPPDVNRGEPVHIDVRSGGAHLQMEGRAITQGALGQTVVVVNPVSKRRFPARVTGKGTVSIEKGGSS